MFRADKKIEFGQAKIAWDELARLASEIIADNVIVGPRTTLRLRAIDEDVFEADIVH